MTSRYDGHGLAGPWGCRLALWSFGRLVDPAVGPMDLRPDSMDLLVVGGQYRWQCSRGGTLSPDGVSC